jgi:glutathione synthase/RimK-type ligase-like ATP-grasp enzyme
VLEFVEKVGFPLIVKPRRGARSNGVSVVRETRELTEVIKVAGAESTVHEAIGTADEEYPCGAVVLGGKWPVARSREDWPQPWIDGPYAVSKLILRVSLLGTVVSRLFRED